MSKTQKDFDDWMYFEPPTTPKRRDNGSAESRVSCDLFIVLDLAAALAFLIGSLCQVSWINYTTAYDIVITNPNSSVYYFTRYRTLFSICPSSAQEAVNALGCAPLDLAQTAIVNGNDTQYWSIISMRRTEIAFFIIAVILAGTTFLLHIFCCIPKLRRKTDNGFWKGGFVGGILSGTAAGFQIIGMAVFQADMYSEAMYTGSNCVDCFGSWPSFVSTQTAVVFGPGYALGWCSAGLLVYASVAYLTREFCVVYWCHSPSYDIKDAEDVVDAPNVAEDAYTKGTAREMQFRQIAGTVRIQQRRDPKPAVQPLHYPSLQGYY